MNNIDEILNDYSERMKSMANYYYLISFFINRNKFKEFSNEEFYNLVIQILCFLFDKSIKRECCFKDDIIDFINILNIRIYKKDLNDDYLNELISYIIGLFNNNGKPYYFDIYSLNNKESVNVNLVTSNVVSVAGQDKLSYLLTDDGYKFLLKTKEYDELLTIKVNQIVAEIRLNRGDFIGAKGEIDNIINNLEYQKQRIENHLKAIKSDISYINNKDFRELLRDSLDILNEEMVKYDEFHKSVKNLITDKELILEEKNNDSLDKLIKQLNELKELIESIKKAQNSATSLINKIVSFDKEYQEILNMLLRINNGKKFSFKDVILNTIESDFSKIEALKYIYKPLFGVKAPNLFGIHTAYQEQPILRDIDDSKEIYQEEDSMELIQDNKLNELIKYNEDFYFNFMDKLINFGLNKDSFTLKEFMNYYIKNNQKGYIDLTKDSKLFRSLLLDLVNINTLSLLKIKKELDKVSYSQSIDFSVHRTFKSIFNKNNSILSLLKNIKITQQNEEMQVKTEINLDKMTMIPVIVPNILFEFN